MNLDKKGFRASICNGLYAIGLGMGLAVTSGAEAAPVFWTGANINFTQAGGNADMLVSGAVSLGRGQNNRLYNAVKESFHGTTSPTDTEWATATPAVIADLTQAPTLTYVSFDSWVGGHAGFNAVANFIKNKHAVVHLITENIYIAIDFSAWGAGFSGGFAYTRSTPAAVVPPPPTPTVTLTSPTNNAVFSAPANVHLAANASVSSGVVTNVSFINKASDLPLGSVQASPFNFTADNLAAGSYALVAVATAGGVSATSAVVNISVINPLPVTTSQPVTTNGQFKFSCSVDPGLTYVVQNSSNLVDWLPLVTNVPSGNSFQVTDTFDTNGLRFYRVARLPNP